MRPGRRFGSFATEDSAGCRDMPRASKPSKPWACRSSASNGSSSREPWLLPVVIRTFAVRSSCFAWEAPVRPQRRPLPQSGGSGSQRYSRGSVALGEYGLWITLGQPRREGVEEGKTDHEDGDSYEDLRATVCCLGAYVARRGESKNEGERVQAVVARVGLLVLQHRQHGGGGGDHRDCPLGWCGDRHGDSCGGTEGGSDRLLPDPLSFA